jgi:glutathione S-transferase
VPYANKLYLQPNDWVTDRASATFNDWIFVDLPYLIDKDVRLTEAIPIMTYIAEVYGPAGIMGKTPEDQTCVDMFLWSIDSVMKRLIRISCPKQSPEDAEKERIELWNLHVKEKLKFMETSSRIGEWFLGYITICDFVIYEMVSYL